MPFDNLPDIGQSHYLCLQIVWQPTRRRMSDGVLGSPEMNFVATEQTKTRTKLDINFAMKAANYIAVIVKNC